MAQYVYILSDYEEHGARNVTATLDRSRLLDMVDKNWPDARPDWRDKAKAGLAEHLERTDAFLAEDGGWAHDCHDGWGGMQLHVVELV